MKSPNLRRWTSGFALVSALTLAPMSHSWGADPNSPLAKTPQRVYPSGARVSQTYVKPEAGEVADPFEAVGRVSPSAAMSHLKSQPTIRAREQKQLTYLLRNQMRIPVGQVNGLEAAAEPMLYKFGYTMEYKGVPLWKYSSQSQFIQVRGNTRRSVFLRERNVPDLDQMGDTVATITSDEAVRLGLDDSRQVVQGPIRVDAENAPPRREIHVDANGKPTLAWAFLVHSASKAQPYARRYWVAARDEARILDKEDLIYNLGPEPEAAAASQQGSVVGNLFGLGKSPLDAADLEGLNMYRVSDTPRIVTDAGGFFTPVNGMQFNLQLRGPYCRIINSAGTGIKAKQTGNTLTFNARTPEEIAQVTAFKWVSTAHAFVADFLPAGPTRLDDLPTNVNLDDTCNAFFDPTDHTLNFFHAGDGCMNTAYCDVACHEFGHAVDDVFGDILDGGYSEGFGDSLAILITRDSIIGRDFQGRGNPLRNAKDVITWPPRDPEVHEVGRIYGGFAWELTQQLLSKFNDPNKAFETARRLILGAAALNPKDTPDAVRLSFFVDRQNGSANFRELAAAADSRRIPRPDSPEDIDNPRFLAAGTR